MVKPTLRTKSIGLKVREDEVRATRSGGAEERAGSGAARFCWRG